MFRDWAAAAVLAIVVTGCGFEINGATGDGGPIEPDPDAAPLPTVGFALPGQTQDESSGPVMVQVTLSPGALGSVSVPYSFGGDAILGTDYTASAGTLVFAIGETTKSISLMIIADQEAESSETILISLMSPTGATLGSATHAITIGANTLPRVNLSTASSMTDEGTAVTITMTLDKMANGPSSVTYTIGGGTALAAGTYADYTLASGVVNFPIGSTMQTLPLGVINDLRNELDETLDITLTTSTGVVLGTLISQTHTILNNDAVPGVSFSPAMATVAEGDTGTAPATLTVTLSAASGRTVTVPFAVNAAGTSTTDPTDYTLVGSSVTFVEGDTVKMITINVTGDLINEPTETLALNITAPADLSATLGGAPIGQLTITDNDSWCRGSGTFRVCYSSLPTNAVALSGTISTNSGAPLCEVNQPIGWTTGGQPSACVIVGSSITVASNTFVSGSRPLVLVADDGVTISATLDVASHLNGNSGPGAPFGGASCTSFLQSPGIGGGGAGGSFVTIGGDGGLGALGANAGRAANQVIPPLVLRAGCSGQLGDSGNEVGHGGGAVYILAGGNLRISGNINASGSAGTGGSNSSGGSGGGSGGMVVLYAASINAGGGLVMANGGGAASGGSASSSGGSGNDPVLSAPTTPATGGPANAGGKGGNGYAGTTAATDGANSSVPTDGGGGGGGGGGYVRANVAPGGTVSAGVVDIIP